MSGSLPEHASTLIVGAGVNGLSLAYHLAEELESRGRSGEDIVVVEKQRPGAGASGISSGLVRNFYRSPAVNEIIARSVELFELDAAGFGYRPIGYVAAVPEEQLDDLEAIAEQHASVGYRSRLVTGVEATTRHMRSLFPDWRAEGIVAALHEQQGGWADPERTVRNLAGMARSLGVRIVEGVEVTDFDLHGSTVRAVETDRGTIGCDLVALAPGPWAPRLWRLLGLPAEIELAGPDGPTRVPMFSATQIREANCSLAGLDPHGHLTAADGTPGPIVHVDHAGPLVSAQDGRVLEQGAWGVYFREGNHGGVHGGGMPLPIELDEEIEPYGPAHPRHGALDGDFADWFTSALASVLGRFDAPASAWRSETYGVLGVFTPDSYPVVDFVLPNAYVMLDAVHAFKMLWLGRLAALDILDGRAPGLDPFRLARYGTGVLHPVSQGPYPWT